MFAYGRSLYNLWTQYSNAITLNHKTLYKVVEFFPRIEDALRFIERNRSPSRNFQNFKEDSADSADTYI